MYYAWLVRVGDSRYGVVKMSTCLVRGCIGLRALFRTAGFAHIVNYAC